jgi:hypothetical protein
MDEERDEQAPPEIAAGFNAGDFGGDTWRRLAHYLEARREHLRTENDGDLAVDRTAKLRGRIQEITDLLDLPRRLAQWQDAADQRDS